jgi:hypothetical protein
MQWQIHNNPTSDIISTSLEDAICPLVLYITKTNQQNIENNETRLQDMEHISWWYLKNASHSENQRKEVQITNEFAQA